MKLIFSSVRYIGILLLIIVVVAGPLVLVRVFQIKAMIAAGENMVMPPETVTSAEAKPGFWENTIASTGSLAAVQGVTVGAEVPGKVVKIRFESGDVANAGDVLVELDVSTEQAQLRAFEANLALAKANLQRARDLRQNNTNSPAELDAADAQAKQAEAQVEGIRALIQKKFIKAPFTGRLGLRLVNLGQILREGDPIAALQTLDPIYVNFALPQHRLAQLSTGTAVRVTSDAAPGAVFEGKITAISPEVDASSRNIRLQATIANGDEKLRSGMFANVEVVLPTKSDVLAIPVTAILYAPYGDSVFVIDEVKDEKSGKTQQVLRQQFIRVEGARGDFVNVVDGLKAGQLVVSSGVFKLRAGMVVVIDNTLAPDAQLAPKPKNA